MRHAVEDGIVYGLLRYHQLVKPQTPPLEEHIQQALEIVRAELKNYDGDIELVAIEPPDIVKVQLVGTCKNCPASTLTLQQGVEQTLKTYCPEITKVLSVNDSTIVINEKNSDYGGSFSLSQEIGWISLATINEISNGKILSLDIEGLKLILTRQGEQLIVYGNSCSHLAMPLDTGEIQDGILTCPHHGFKYCLATGEYLTVSGMSLETYSVERYEDRILVRVSSDE